MKVVYFLPDIEAGVSRIVRNLLKYRPHNDIQYWAVLMRQKENRDQHYINELFQADKTIVFEYSSLDNLYNVYKKMAALLSPEDVIVGNDGYEIRMVVALKLKNPVVYIIHGDFEYYYSICKLNQSIIDLFIAYSEKIYRQLKKDLEETNTKKVRLIYYPSAALENGKVLTAKSKTFKIVFAGYLTERKGAHLLYTIYNKLSQLIPDFIFEIIGTGYLEKEIKTQFVNAPNVIVSGWQPHGYVMNSLMGSQVFLFPSFLEGLPNVLIEALSVGAIPVSSNLESGITDIIEHEKNGILVETGNADAFAIAIAELYQKPEKLDRLINFSKQNLLISYGENIK
jgi:glycosyltransferase involved in cell wall biosynthesis